LNWFEKEYVGKEGIPVMIHPYTKLAYDAYPTNDTMILDTEGLQKLVSNIGSFVSNLSLKNTDSWNTMEIIKLITDYKLDSGSIKDHYLSKARK
jgi:hypothetical protein